VQGCAALRCAALRWPWQRTKTNITKKYNKNENKPHACVHNTRAILAVIMSKNSLKSMAPLPSLSMSAII
jgi:hypothetical protein